MMPDVMIDMTAFLVPFAAGCAGFVAVVFIVLLGRAISGDPRNPAGIDLRRTPLRPRRRMTAAA